MARILIVGIGNPLRSDDGVGLLVAQELLRELPAESDTQVIAAHQLTPEIAEFASRAERVLFVDAARGGEPGSVACKRIALRELPSRYSHDFSPVAIVQLAERLYGRCPPAYLITIAGANFETGETISEAVTEAVPALKAKVKQMTSGGDVTVEG
jgi:hydrogenase maturation protease